MNIVLIGYRGTGKSTVAKILAQRTSRKVISTDERIIETAGMSIPEIVGKYDWDYFRDIESKVVAEVSRRDGIIIDAGGGVIIREKNTQALRATGIVFWLTATVDTIAGRIGSDDQRPSLTEKKSFIEEIREVLEARTPLYRAAAHHIIETDNKTPLEVAEQILSDYR